MASGMHQHESATGMNVSPILNPLPPPSLPHSSELSLSTDFGCLASCIELSLVIHFTYGNIDVSVWLPFHILYSSAGKESACNAGDPGSI